MLCLKFFALELSTCQYRDFNDRHSNYVDKLSIAATLIDCQRQCDSEYSFHCKSVNYNPITQECALSSEDSLSMLNVVNDDHYKNIENIKTTSGVAVSEIISAASTITDYLPGSIYTEKGNCEQGEYFDI